MEAKIDILSDTWQRQWMPAIQDGMLHLSENERTVLTEAFGVLVPSQHAGSIQSADDDTDEAESTLDQAITSLSKQAWATSLSNEDIVSVLRIAAQSEWFLKDHSLSQEELEIAESIVQLNVREQGEGEEPASRSRRATDRPSVSRGASSGKGFWRKAILISASGLLVLYVVLVLTSLLTRPAFFEEAQVEAFADVLTQNVRTEDASSTPFLSGAQELLQARSSYLGLFPHYNESHVRAAIGLLEVSYNASTDPVSKAKAAFFLGKAHLMNENPTEAASWFQTVLDQNVKAYRSESEALLSAL